MTHRSNENKWLDDLVEDITLEYGDQGDEGFLGCAWHMWRFGNIINDCNKEIAKHCGEGKGNMECARFLSEKGATGLSDALFKCLKKRDPERFKKLLNSCGKTSLNRLLKR